mmetsp:Transcript_96735/g.250175  ORF Transcript_96735/g.250175 Transcript_96735/m.250175 type:complete len:244 (-) Transcript_96735:138-869(-)
MVFVVHEHRKDLSWETIITVVFSSDFKNSSSHVTAGTSRWFVGSSSSRRSGCTNKAWAKAIRMRQPPLNSLVGLCWSSPLKPRPDRITAARASASSLKSSSSRSYTSIKPTPWTVGSLPDPSSSCASSSCSTLRSHSRSLSAVSTLRSTGVSSPVISCSTCIVIMCLAMGTRPSRSAMARRSVLFPTPLRPMRPYFWPCTSFKLALYSSSCLPANTMISVASTSMEAPVRLGASGPVLGWKSI